MRYAYDENNLVSYLEAVWEMFKFHFFTPVGLVSTMPFWILMAFVAFTMSVSYDFFNLAVFLFIVFCLAMVCICWATILFLPPGMVSLPTPIARATGRTEEDDDRRFNEYLLEQQRLEDAKLKREQEFKENTPEVSLLGWVAFIFISLYTILFLFG